MPFYLSKVDPVRTISAGKVNLGAFRTYPKVRIKNLFAFYLGLIGVLF